MAIIFAFVLFSFSGWDQDSRTNSYFYGKSATMDFVRGIRSSYIHLLQASFPSWRIEVILFLLISVPGDYHHLYMDPAFTKFHSWVFHHEMVA